MVPPDFSNDVFPTEIFQGLILLEAPLSGGRFAPSKWELGQGVGQKKNKLLAEKLARGPDPVSFQPFKGI